MKNKFISKHHEQAAVEIRLFELNRIAKNKSLPSAIRKNATQLYKYWNETYAVFHVKKRK